MIINDEQSKLMLSANQAVLKNWLNQRPFELEIGCGKDLFLLHRSQEAEDHQFLGMDWSWKWIKVGLERYLKYQRPNVRFLKGEAFSFFEDVLWDECIDVCHIYFPDPWPKKKHRKRRLLQAPFIDLVHRRLKPGGILYIGTDFLDYYSCIQNAIYTASSTWSRIHHSNLRELFPACPTSYEVKYHKEGRSFSFIQLHK